MAFVGTTYVCQFLEPHEDGSSGDHAMAGLGTTCDGICGDHIRMPVLGST